MADALDLILIGSPAEAAQPAQGMPQTPAMPPQASQPDRADTLDLILGRTTGQVAKKAAEVTDDPNRRLGFIGQAKASFAATDDQWKRIAAKELYPNEPVETAAKRFQTTEDGQRYHVGPDGKAYAIQAHSGLGRLANVGEGVGGALPAVGGAAAGILGAAYTGGLGSVLAAGSGAYAGDTVRQMIGNAIDPGKGPAEYNPVHAGVQAAGGAAGQAIGVGLGRFAQRFNPSDIAHLNPQAANDLADRAANIGVRLTPAESTGLASLAGEQKSLSGSPRATNRMGQFFEERNREVMDAWQNFLNRIGPGRDAGDLGVAAKRVATDAVEGAQAARTAAVQPFYQQAERQIGSVNPGNVARFIADEMPTAKGSERAALRFVQSQLQRAGADGATDGTIDMSFRGLNGAKQAIDTMLQNEDLAMKQGIDRTAHRTLQRARDMIVQAIENAPGAQGAGGSPGPYAAGRRLYGWHSENVVTPMQEVLAPLLRANPANSSIVRTAQSVLDPATRTPDLVTRARAIIEPQAPEVWQGMVRQFLQDHAQSALQENAKGQVSNVGGNIAKKIGNDMMERNLRAALTPQQYREYLDLVDVFRATGRAMDTNSDTAFKQEALKRAKATAGGVLGRVASVVDNINPARALNNTSEFFRNNNFERQAEEIARIYTSGNRQAIDALRSLRQLSPSDIRRRMIIGHIIERGAENTVPAAADYVLQ